MLFDEPIFAALPSSHRLAKTTPCLTDLAECPPVAYPATHGRNFADIVIYLFRQRGLGDSVI